MRNIVILISGRGSNMQAVVEAAIKQSWPVNIAAVISNRADAEGLKFARSHHIPAEVLPNKEFASRELFDAALREMVDQYSPDLVILAGFMRILTSDFVSHYAGRIVNIHPSLLPSFPGLATHQQALEAGVKVHGATVHFVTPELDHGPIIAQVAIPVLPDDTESSLAERVLVQEHVIYPEAIRWFIEGRLRIENGRVVRVGC
jgi:phosphoribosylglycinamide formyltransferase-1